MTRVFNRGYTAGYGPGLVDRSLMEDEAEKHVEGRAGIMKISRPVLIDARLTAITGAPLALCVSDGEAEASVLGEAVEAAKSRPAGRGAVTAQLQKDRRHALRLPVGGDYPLSGCLRVPRPGLTTCAGARWSRSGACALTRGGARRRRCCHCRQRRRCRAGRAGPFWRWRARTGKSWKGPGRGAPTRSSLNPRT